MTDTDLISQAADKLDRILVACTPGPWRRTGYGSDGWTVSALDGGFSVETADSEPGKADAAWLETMNPTAGNALVGMLRHTAARGGDQSHVVTLAQAILDQCEAS